MTTIKWELFLFSTEAVQTDSLMGYRAARIGGCGVPVPGAKALGALGEELGPPTKAGAAPPRRGLPDEGVAVLDFPWSDGSFPWRGDGVNNPLPFSRRGSGGKRRPPVAPGCRGSRGVPDGRGRRGAPGRANALSSPGRQRKGRRKRKSEDKKTEPIDAEAIPGKDPGALNHAIEGWGPGVGRAGTLPSP
jgi:hypothetical protein